LEVLCSVVGGRIGPKVFCVQNNLGTFAVITQSDAVVGMFLSPFGIVPMNHTVLKPSDCGQINDCYLAISEFGVSVVQTSANHKLVEAKEIKWSFDGLVRRIQIYFEGVELLGECDALKQYDINKGIDDNDSVDTIRITNLRVVSDLTALGCVSTGKNGSDVLSVSVRMLAQVLDKFCFLGPVEFIRDHVLFYVRGNIQKVVKCKAECPRCGEPSIVCVNVEFVKGGIFDYSVSCFGQIGEGGESDMVINPLVVPCIEFVELCCKLRFVPSIEQYWFFKNSGEIHCSVKDSGCDELFLEQDPGEGDFC